MAPKKRVKKASLQPNRRSGTSQPILRQRIEVKAARAKKKAEKRIAALETRASEAESRALFLEKRASDAEKRASDAEQRVAELEVQVASSSNAEGSWSLYALYSALDELDPTQAKSIVKRLTERYKLGN